MLEASEQQLADAPAAERSAAEAFAASYLATQMEQDLIPAEEARSTVAEHRQGATKEWRRAVYAALIGLRAIKA